MNTENNTEKIQLLSKAKSFIKSFKHFNYIIDCIFNNCLIFSIKLSVCTNHGVGDSEKLKQTQFEVYHRFKLLCQMFSKYKKLKKIIYLPCESIESHLTIDENVEFSFDYENVFNFVDRHQLKSYIEKYKTTDRFVEKVHYETFYTDKDDFYTLNDEINTIERQIQEDNIDIEVLKLKLCRFVRTLKNCHIFVYESVLANINEYLEESYRRFNTDFYYKCMLKLQQQFEYQKESNENESCVICLEEFQSGKLVTKLKCGHVFCTKCIEQWFSKSLTCPHCRKDFNK